MRALALLLVACASASLAMSCTGTHSQRPYVSHLASVTNYTVSTQRRSPAGVHYGGDLDYLLLDQKVGRVAVCLRDIKEPTPEEHAAMECLPGPIRRDVTLENFDVFLAPDWRKSACSGELVFKCGIDPKYCLEKGVTPTEECPCRCRATIQNGRTVVTAPNMKLFNAELVRLVTGCNVIWNGPLAECGAP